ncbi:MAG: tetratricopeptide repeat protein [Burkholderiales bacterium]|nr:tetratricopeptide repeat protein [Burkholderiales bacterium]
MKIERNAPCACGSGKKNKHCCQAKGEHRPSVPSAELSQLIALFHAGRYAEMESQARALVERYPGSGIAWKLFGTALGVQGKDALSALQKAAVLLPGDVEVHINLGNVLQDLGQIDGAIVSYRRALGLNPHIAEVHNNLGNAQKDLGQLDVAVASYRRALSINPQYAEAYNNLGVALQDVGRPDDAVANFGRALEINPNFVEAYGNLGNALKDLGRLDAALASFRRALEIQPDSAEAHNNLGVALEALGQAAEAVASYRRALEIKPDYAHAHSNLAHVLLALGDFERGWLEYAWRYSRDAANVPLPEAKSLLPFTSAGKRILLCYEQGIGDELFFLQFAPQLREQAQWVGYWSTPKVHTLIARAGCVDQVFSRLDEAPPRDLILPVGDLPLLLACNSTEAIPPSLRFSPTEQHVAKVHQRLSELGLTGQRILGVTWRGGSPSVPGRRKTLFKQIGLDLLADAIKDWAGAIIVLQRKPAAGEIEQLRAQVLCPVHDLSEYNDDLESMLALLDVIDEYVGVSNANMHLMAGLGKTARVLIPFPAEWRWMASGDQSPWFPGFKLYRQSVAGGWGQPLAALKHDLCHHV